MPKNSSNQTNEKKQDKITSGRESFLIGDDNQPKASRSIHILCIGICIIFAIWVWLLNPIDRLFDDQLNIVTLQLTEDHPENFARDPIYGGNAGDFYPSAYQSIIRWLTNRFGLIGGHRIAQFPLMVAYLAVMYFVLYALTRSASAALLIALFSALWHDSMGGSYWGMGRMQTVQPRSLVLIWAPLLLIMAWKYRRSWMLMVVFFVLGLLINISPPGALFFAAAVWIATLFEGRITKQKLLYLGSAFAALLIGAAPFIYCHITARTGLAADLSIQDRQLFMQALQFRFSQMSSFPVPLKTVCTVLLRFSVPLLLAAAGWVVRGKKRNALDWWLLIFFLFSAVGYVVLQYLMQKISASMQQTPPIVNIHRGQKNAYLVLYIYGAIFLRYLFLQIGRIDRRTLIAIGAAVIFAMPLITFARQADNPDRQWSSNVSHFSKLMRGEKIETIGWYPMVIPVARWARENTPPDSLFLFAHYNMPLFRIYALRSMVSSSGCGGIALYNGPRRMIYWYKAQKVLMNTKTKRGVEQLAKFAEDTGSDYIILSRNTPSVPGWSPVAYDNYWIVYAPASSPPAKPTRIRDYGLK